MGQPAVQIIGVYQVAMTEASVQEAMDWKYGGITLSAAEKKEAEEYIREELSSVVLLDIIVTNPDSSFDLTDFHQPGSDQVAYNEAFLDPDGRSILSYFEPPQGNTFRVVFFLHFFDPHLPLETPYGLVSLPGIEEMPPHLQSLHPYQPID